VFSLVFGTLDQALESARRLHARHAAITGVLPEAAGPFPQGSSYRANELDALRWVHATLVDTALMAHDLVMPTLSRGERERFYLESKLFAALFGIPADTLPPGWNGFAAYVESMLGSDVLTVSSDARRIADRLLSGTGTGLITPGWYRAVTAMLLPERLRFGFGLPYGNKERRAADGALRWIRRVYPVLPVRLRFVAPYQVAQARLSGRGKPDFAVRALNKLWTGRSIS
jgi:uncharacterized protein (DUF2236 family)